MDKAIMKSLFAQAGLPQVQHRVLTGRDAAAEARLVEELGLPLFVKPANLGSSVAVSKVKTREALAPALALAFAYDRKVVAESGHDVREIEVGCWATTTRGLAARRDRPGPRVLRLRLQVRGRQPDRARDPRADRCDARGPRSRTSAGGVSCGGRRRLARVDCFLERASGRLLLNEINTIPGFTSISMYPKLWQASGISYPDLLARLVGSASSGIRRARVSARTTAADARARGPRTLVAAARRV